MMTLNGLHQVLEELKRLKRWGSILSDSQIEWISIGEIQNPFPGAPEEEFIIAVVVVNGGFFGVIKKRLFSGGEISSFSLAPASEWNCFGLKEGQYVDRAKVDDFVDRVLEMLG